MASAWEFSVLLYLELGRGEAGSQVDPEFCVFELLSFEPCLAGLLRVSDWESRVVVFHCIVRSVTFVQCRVSSFVLTTYQAQPNSNHQGG